MRTNPTLGGFLLFSLLLPLRLSEAAPASAPGADLRELSPGLSAEWNRARMNYLAESIDAGDAYQTPKGMRRLRRLPDAIAVTARDSQATSTFQQALTAKEGPLADHKPLDQMGRDIFLFRRSPAKAGSVEEKVSEYRAVAARVRRDPDVRLAMPVFVCPESGLLMVPMAEVIVRLKPYHCAHL